ncbi:hypothetical protein K4L81_27130, partial [Pseudomonas syringae pv. tomato]|uniref:hypothetical protein n=1 Tax=Pseudomonas syringae group genomosp. 3 TaxID=251701 RepID=UPI001C831F78
FSVWPHSLSSFVFLVVHENLNHVCFLLLNKELGVRNLIHQALASEQVRFRALSLVGQSCVHKVFDCDCNHIPRLIKL